MPLSWLTSQKQEALAYLMFLKRKRCGRVIGCGCTDGQKQHAYTTRDDAASPTVATESVFLTTVIDALEGWDIAVIDVPGAFMQADMDELLHVCFTGKMVDLLLEIDLEMYRPCIIREGKEKVMYVELLKALYGTIHAAWLFWEKLSGKLLEWVFTPNPYDPCMMNKTVEDKQLTVAWHIDDLKVSHPKSTVVDQFIEDVENKFGKETPLNKSCGKVHDYLGMMLNFSKTEEVTVTMIDYIKGILHDALKEMHGKAATPAANHLFRINLVDPVWLGKEKAEIYMHIVMQLLYLSQRMCPDLHTAVSFLCSRLTQPDEDDYKKLVQVIKYLDSTVDMPLVLAVDDTRNIQWWVDTSYAVHDDMKSHTGGTMSMEKGSIYSTSTKQKLVTRSSIEAKIIGVHDVMPQLIWTTQFLDGQGVNIDESILYQDNTSSILIEKNGRSSRTKCTRHMNIWYFFIKDQVNSKHVKIEHCPTADMIADFFMKPLQGTQFRKLRDQIMNIAPSSAYHSKNSGHRSVLKPKSPSSDDISISATLPRSYKEVLLDSETTKK
jgi:Reverse transcriptase (RNA-dependent DNA polymerase)